VVCAYSVRPLHGRDLASATDLDPEVGQTAFNSVRDKLEPQRPGPKPRKFLSRRTRRSITVLQVSAAAIPPNDCPSVDHRLSDAESLFASLRSDPGQGDTIRWTFFAFGQLRGASVKACGYSSVGCAATAVTGTQVQANHLRRRRERHEAASSAQERICLTRSTAWGVFSRDIGNSQALVKG